MENATKTVNEKNFIWNDVKISTLYSNFRTPTYAAAAHVHPQSEMFVFGECHGEITVEEKKIKVQRNLAVIVPPETEHSMKLECQSGIEGMMVRFVYKHAGTATAKGSDKIFKLFDDCMPKKGDALVIKNEYFGTFASSFYDERESSEILASLLIRHLIEGLFLEVLRSSHTSSSDDTSIYSYTSRALSNELIVAVVIDDYMHLPGCTLTVLSEKLKMSPRNIQRIIRSTYGKSFSERIAELRIDSAIRMMGNSSLTLSEISQKANYNRYDSFRKAFVARMGVSPTEYRESRFGIKDKE